MRRGKGDEKKVVGPLFPRLHVNDTTEKGGPRAPPRNKMALYEQLTVPFQRFNPNSTSSLGLKPAMSVKHASAGEVVDSPVRQAKVIIDQEDRHCPVSNITRLHHGDACLQQECITGSQSNHIEDVDGILDSTMDMCNTNSHVMRGSIRSTMKQICPLEGANDTESHDTGNGSPTQKGSSDESDDLSKISGEENLSSQKLSPDGVSKILGQKLFWKARRKITNQQKAFAVQVFELHRLIQVQQQFAGSPDLLPEAAAFLGKIPLEGSTPENIAVEVVIEPQQQNLKQQNHSEKRNRKMEYSAENAVGNTSFPSQKNGTHLSNYYSHQENVAADDRMKSWSFDPSHGHQWLIPVMSPSEGLIYKPYPGPGFPGAVYGGCAPFGQGPLDGTFMNPYGVPSFHQAIAVSPFIPPGSYGYYPHGTPGMNQSASGSAVEQVNQFSAQVCHGQNGHSSVEEANQNSYNLPYQKNGATKSQASKKRELQGSIKASSSPNEMAQEIRTKKFAKGRDAHSHSIKAPLVLEKVLQSLETRKHTQVIKVVPRNPRSASESVARIFQSIQEERNQYDLV